MFDLTALTWTNVFNPEAASYALPAVIADIYAGRVKGPKRWDSEALQQVFIGGNIIMTDTSVPAPSTRAESPTPAPVKPKSNIGAIAGGLVGGVAGLAIIAGLAFWLLRRKNAVSKHASARPPTMAENTAAFC